MNGVKDIHDRTLGDGDDLAVVGFQGLLEGKDGIVEHIGLNEYRFVGAGLLIAVDGDHLYACFVPVLTAFVREDLKILAAFTTHHFAVTEDEGFDLVHQTVLCVSKADGTVYKVSLFHLTRIVFSRLAGIVYFNLVKNHIITNYQFTITKSFEDEVCNACGVDRILRHRTQGSAPEEQRRGRIIINHLIQRSFLVLHELPTGLE